MADDIDVTPGTGKTARTEDIGAKQHQWVVPVWGPLGTANKVDVATGKPLPIQVRSATGLIPIGEPTDAKSTATDTTSVSGISIWKQISASVQSLVTNIGTLTFTATRLLVRGEPRMFSVAGTVLTRPANTTAYTALDSISDNATAGSVTALPITLSDTNDDPISIERLRLTTADTGIAGKNVRAWLYNSDPTASTGVVGGDNAAFANKRAGFVGTMSGLFRAMNDGSVACLVPDEGSRLTVLPGTGAKTVWYQLQTLDTFTPSANSTTFTPTMEGYQGRA